MSRFIRRHRSQFGRVSVVVLTMGALLVTSMFALTLVNDAEAAELTARSVTIGDSDHAVQTDYVFTFTLQTALTTDATAAADASFNFDFPVDAGGDPFTIPNFAAGDATVTCTSCATSVFSVTAVVESDGGGAAAVDDVYVAVNETGQDSAAIPVGSVITVTLGTGATLITNPADDAAGCTAGATNEDADICSITVESHDDATATNLQDNGDVLAAYISDVTVSVTVEENLTFNIDGEDEATCEAQFADYGAGRYIDSQTDPFNLNFGNISTFDAFFNTCHDLAVTTNASSGYIVTVEEDTSLLSGAGDTIDDTICDGGTCDEDPANAAAWGTATNNGFGYSCYTELDDDAGSVCEIGTETTTYAQFACTGVDADCDPGVGAEAPQTVFSDTATGDDSVLIEYKLSVGGTQPAGLYTTQVTYIATPTF